MIALLGLIRAVQANAFRAHPRAEAYGAYLDAWFARRAARLQHECIELRFDAEAARP